MNAKQYRVSACTLGCKVNQYDTTAMLERLAAAGYKVVPWGERADIYLVNTCTVTNTADKKSGNMIRRVTGQRDAVVLVCGCMAQHGAERLLKDGVSAVIGTEDRGNIVAVAERCLAGGKVNAVRAVSTSVFEEMGVSTGGEMTRGYIKIQEGCDSFCSYCIIPYVRGRSRSRDAGSILREAAALSKNGVKEIVLTGIHISSYGGGDGEDILRLLRALSRTEGILRIRLGSLEPHILTDGFVRELAGLEKVCRHFHVSMQSGSDAVLKRMNRGYTAARYAARVAAIRRHYESPAITTDIITGFPGESEAEFLETAAFTEKMAFARVHVFPYSEREGTPAAIMEGGVPPSVRKERARELIALGKKLESAYAQSFAGTVQTALFEREQVDGAEGYTDRYVRVRASGARAGECRGVLLKNFRHGIMDGEIVD